MDNNADDDVVGIPKWSESLERRSSSSETESCPSSPRAINGMSLDPADAKPPTDSSKPATTQRGGAVRDLFSSAVRSSATKVFSKYREMKQNMATSVTANKN